MPKPKKPVTIPATYTPAVGAFKPIGATGYNKIKTGDVFWYAEHGTAAVMVVGKQPSGDIKYIYLDDPAGGPYSQTYDTVSQSWSKTHPKAAEPQHMIDQDAYEHAAKILKFTLAAPKPTKTPKTATTPAVPATYTANTGPKKPIGKVAAKKLTPGTIIYGTSGAPYMIMTYPDVAKSSVKIMSVESFGGNAFDYPLDEIAKHTSLTHPYPEAANATQYAAAKVEAEAQIANAPATKPKAPKTPTATTPAPSGIAPAPKMGTGTAMTSAEMKALKPGQIIYMKGPGAYKAYPYMVIGPYPGISTALKVQALDAANQNETYTSFSEASWWTTEPDKPAPILQSEYEKVAAKAGVPIVAAPTAAPAPAPTPPSAATPPIGNVLPLTPPVPKIGLDAELDPDTFKNMKPGQILYEKAHGYPVMIVGPTAGKPNSWDLFDLTSSAEFVYDMKHGDAKWYTLEPSQPLTINQAGYEKAAAKAGLTLGAATPIPVAPQTQAPAPATPPPGSVPGAGVLQKLDPAEKINLQPGRIIYTTTGVPLIVTEIISPPGSKGVGIAAISAVDGEEWWIDDKSKMNLYVSHDKPKPIDPNHYATAQQIISGGTAIAPPPQTPTPPVASPIAAAPVIQTPVGTFQHKVGQFQALDWDTISKLPNGTILYYQTINGQYHPVTLAGFAHPTQYIDVDDLYDGMAATAKAKDFSLTAPYPEDPDPQIITELIKPKTWIKGQPLDHGALNEGEAFQGMTEYYTPPVGKAVVSLFGTPCVVTAPYDPQTKEIEVANLITGSKVKVLLGDISYGHPTPGWADIDQKVLDDLMTEIAAKYGPMVQSQAVASPNVQGPMSHKHYPVPPGMKAAGWTKLPEETQKSIWQHIQSIAGTPKKPHGMPQQVNTGWASLSLWEKKTLAAMQAVANGDPTPPAKKLPATTDVGNIKWAPHQSGVLDEGVFQTHTQSLLDALQATQPNTMPPAPPPVPPKAPSITPPPPPPIPQLPTEREYWEGLANSITLASTEAAYNTILAGANAAYEMGVDVDFEGIHREALHITKTTVPMMAALMAESTRNAVQAALLKYQTEGLGKRGLPDLIAELQAATGANFDKKRARKIAVTEVTRLFAEGNRLATLYDDSVGGLQWQAAADELMCPVCGERHMKIYPKSSPPPCPAHVLCRCALIPATWDYIRQNASAWQGGPIPAEEALLAEPQAVTAPQIVPPESEAEFPWTEADLTALPRGNIGGGHEKYLYQAPDGSKWLFKPDETAGMAELAAYRMMHYAGLEAPETYFTTMQGRLGTVQRWHKDIKGGLTDATVPSLTPQQIAQAQALHVTDWIVSQHDTNQGALLINQAGGVLAVDKGQAWKFLGKDKLDYHYNPNGDRQVWPTFFGDYVNGKIDMDRTAAFDQIKKFQAIPENTMRAILGPLAKQQVKLGAWKSEEDFIETILHRQQNLGDDFDRFYTGIEAERRAWDVAHGKVVSKLRPDAITPIDAEFSRKVDASGAWGQSIMVAGDKIENGNLLAYYVAEGTGGKRRLVVEGKIRPGAEAEMLAKMGKTNTGGTVQQERHYAELLTPIKHINHHMTVSGSNTPDGKIEIAKVGGLVTVAGSLKALGPGNPIYQHYSTVLQQITGHTIDQIAGVTPTTLHGWITSHYPDWYKQSGAAAKITEYQPPAPTQPSGPAAPIQARDVTPWHLEMSVDNGELKAAATPGKKEYYRAGAGLEADLGDGVVAVYTMHGNSNQYSQTGRLQIHLPDWNGDPRQVETILNKMDKLGLDVQLATKEDARLTYLYQMAHSMGLRQNMDYKTEVLQPIEDRKPAVSERIRLYKDYLKKNLSAAAYRQLDDEATYMPRFDRTWKDGRRSVEGGWAYWERCDITMAELESQMPGYKLTHSHQMSGYSGKAADFLTRSLKTNGTLANTEERVRMDIWKGEGASSQSDMGTGGAGSLFTRIRSGQGDDYEFDKRLLLRTGNYSFAGDRFGDVQESSYSQRHNDIASWKKIARNGGNETLIKNSFAMFDWVQTIFVRPADRQRMITLLKAAGIDEVRGKRIEDIVEGR